MAEVLSTFELKFGEKAPGFSLPDAWGKTVSLDEAKGEHGMLVVFACNHCPFVIHLAKQLGEFAKEFSEKGIGTVVINSNDVAKYPQDGPEAMKEFAANQGWNFPYLSDETQEVAKAYGAACTPDFFLFDETGGLAYSGQFDATRPGGLAPDGADLRAAIEAMLAGDAMESGKPSSGCNIKWKPGNEPKWF